MPGAASALHKPLLPGDARRVPWRVGARRRAMRVLCWALCCAALATAAAGLGALAARRADQDFEFAEDVAAGTAPDDDDTDEAALDEPPPAPGAPDALPGAPAAPPGRDSYDPYSALCELLVCAGGDTCVRRNRRELLCASLAALRAKGEHIVPPPEPGDDVYYDPAAALDPDKYANDRDKCMHCGAPLYPDWNEVCASDGRVYPSLCQLDFENCRRRPRRAARALCAGRCPCAPGAAPPTPWPFPGLEPAALGPLYMREDGSLPAPAPRAPVPTAPAPRRAARDFRAVQRGSAAKDETIRAGCELERMADRLLDWFSVLMEEARAVPPPPAGFPRDCKPEVRWMFAHLDGDGDGLLSAGELYPLRHDAREPCLRPFLASCARAPRGGGGGAARAAWCACLRRAARPCSALARAHPPMPGAYVPACDARGFYRPRQCHDALGVCWCVSPHGVERAGSRTRGEPRCAPPVTHAPHEEQAPPRTHAEHAPHEEQAPPSDDEDDAGSGDNELRY